MPSPKRRSPAHEAVTAAPGRKVRERNAHRQEIMDAARELFALKGFHNTTLDEVARHAEFGKGTIYNYFSSKEELLYGIIDRLTNDLFTIAQLSIQSRRGDVRDQFVSYAEGMISHARDNADLFNLVIREMNHLDSAKYEAQLKEVHTRALKQWELLARPIAREIRKGRIRGYDPLQLASVFDGMVRTYCMSRFTNMRVGVWDDQEDPGTLLVELFFNGVAQRNRKG